MLTVTTTPQDDLKTTITFGGEKWTLEDLPDSVFEALYDNIINYGSDLADRAANWPAQLWQRNAEWYDKQMDENSHLLDQMGRECERRYGHEAC